MYRTLNLLCRFHIAGLSELEFTWWCLVESLGPWCASWFFLSFFCWHSDWPSTLWCSTGYVQKERSYQLSMTDPSSLGKLVQFDNDVYCLLLSTAWVQLHRPCTCPDICDDSGRAELPEHIPEHLWRRPHGVPWGHLFCVCAFCASHAYSSHEPNGRTLNTGMLEFSYCCQWQLQFFRMY